VAEQRETWVVGVDPAGAADQGLPADLEPVRAGGLDERRELGAIPVVVDGMATLVL